MYEQSGNVNADSVTKKVGLDNNPSEQPNTYTDEQVIPIKEERFSISKEAIIEHIKIEKRWIKKTKKVQVPILKEEIYVNGKPLKYYDKLQGSNIFSKVKVKLKEGLDSVTEDEKELGYSLLDAHESQREIIPLFESVKNGTKINNKETEKVIPIFGEQIVITKRKVKLGELILRKNRVTVNNKIEIDIRKEDASIKHADIIKSRTDEI